MAIEYSYDERANILVFASSGDVSVNERQVAVGRAIHDSSLPMHCDILIDVTGVSAEPAVDDGQLIASLLRQLRERFNGRIAITTGGGAVSKSTVVLIAFLADRGERDLKSFHFREDALLWLRNVV